MHVQQRGASPDCLWLDHFLDLSHNTLLSNTVAHLKALVVDLLIQIDQVVALPRFLVPPLSYCAFVYVVLDAVLPRTAASSGPELDGRGRDFSEIGTR